MQHLFLKYPIFYTTIIAIAIFAALAQRPQIANQLFPWYVWGVMFVASIPFVQACSTGEEDNGPEVWTGPFWHQLILFSFFALLCWRVIVLVLKIDWKSFNPYGTSETSADFIIVIAGFLLGICAIGGLSRCLILLRSKQ